jgi:ankyrin repeat protein
MVNDNDLAALRRVLPLPPQQDDYDDIGRTPIVVATERNHINALRFLVAAGADVNKVKRDTGETPMYIAARWRRLRILEELIASGADVNRGGAGLTPLYGAALINSVEAVRILIEAGADVNIVYDGQTPIFTAVRNNNAAGHNILRVLIEAGADVNIADGRGGDGRGETPIHSAIIYDNEDALRQLIAAGANVNVRRRDTGETPLHVAAKWRVWAGLVRILVDAGADVKARANNGQTPCSIPLLRRNEETIKILNCDPREERRLKRQRRE